MDILQKTLLIATATMFFIIIGGAAYEHLAVVPVWKRCPPRSLSMFAGPYGLTPDKFWKLIHPITLLLTISTLIVCWKTSYRMPLLIFSGGYVLILAITAIYFVPELLRILQTPYSDAVDEALIRRAATWEALSLIRLGVLIVLSSVLLSSFFKVGRVEEQQQYKAVYVR